MPKTRLTHTYLTKKIAPAPAGTRYEIMDTDVPGFGVRVNDKGERHFFIVARFGGAKNPTRRSIGLFSPEIPEGMTLEKARAKASEMRAMARQGLDPKAQVEARKEAEREAKRAQAIQQENTFASVREAYVAAVLVGPDEKKPHLRSGPETAREIRRAFQTLDAEPITSIKDIQIIDIVEALNSRAPATARHVLGHVRRLFAWAVARRRYGLDRSPCEGMRPRDHLRPPSIRTRVLTDAELRALWIAAGKLNYPFGPLVQLLALTGQRRNEIADARWSEVDLKKKVLTIPAERMKSKRQHEVPLAPEVMKILERLPRGIKGDFIFSTTFGAVPVSGFSKAKTRLDKLVAAEIVAADADAKFQDFTFHDIRRTMRTGLSMLPIPDLVRELVIAHTKPGLHQVYDQHRYLEEKRHALELWEARLRDIVEPPPENVVKLGKVG